VFYLLKLKKIVSFSKRAKLKSFALGETTSFTNSETLGFSRRAKPKALLLAVALRVTRNAMVIGFSHGATKSFTIR